MLMTDVGDEDVGDSSSTYLFLQAAVSPLLS